MSSNTMSSNAMSSNDHDNRPYSLIEGLRTLITAYQEVLREDGPTASPQVLANIFATVELLREVEVWIRRTSDTRRGSGRTTCALTAAPDGATYLVHSLGMHGWVRVAHHNLHAGARALSVKSVYNTEALRGITGPIIVDHHVWETVPAKLMFYLDALIAANERAVSK